MTAQERVRRAIHFQAPDRIPHFLPDEGENNILSLWPPPLPPQQDWTNHGDTDWMTDGWGAVRYRAAGGVLGFGEVHTPSVSEAGIAGVAVGAALMGLRPIADVQYGDFLFCAMDQLVNQAAKMRYMSGGKVSVPLVIHGGSGLSEQSVRELLAGGVALLHVGTIMKRRTWEAAEAFVQSFAGVPDYQALVGEVSRVNDDHHDNFFLEQVGRFPDIEEDEPPVHLLCTEYPAAHAKGCA